VNRRAFITLLGSTAAWPLAALAQQPTMPVIGYLSLGSRESDSYRLTGLRQGLDETGYVEGRNLTVEHRWAENQIDRLPALAAQLVQMRVAVIVTPGLVLILMRDCAYTPSTRPGRTNIQKSGSPNISSFTNSQRKVPTGDREDSRQPDRLLGYRLPFAPFDWVAVRPAILDDHVLALDIAGLTQALTGRCHKVRVRDLRPTVDEPYDLHRRPLRASGERPRCCRTANRDNELSPPDVDRHATLPKGSCPYNGRDDTTLPSPGLRLRRASRMRPSLSAYNG
jgi:hypothetical protein